MIERTLVIAEAGVNHNGSIDLALRLVDAAAAAKADVVKFQTFKADRLATARAPKAQYQLSRTKGTESQLEMLRRLELSIQDHEALVARCRDRGIRFMSTAFDGDSLAFLASLDPPAVKIPSGDITNGPLLLQAARLRRPLIVSTGMCTLADIEDALGVLAFGLTREGAPKHRLDFEVAYRSQEGRSALCTYVTLLHCVTAYPTPLAEVNLRAIDTIAVAFGLHVGYSDHTLGTEVSIAAVARGASVIEKHFTLDRALPGPDHAASLEPAELAEMVVSIRNIEEALGSALKAPTSQETQTRLIARRSLVAAQPIRRGDVFTEDLIAAKRPGAGLSPMNMWNILGRPAARDYAVDELIEG